MIVKTEPYDFASETVPRQTIIVVQIRDENGIETMIFTPEEFEEYRKQK